MVELTREPDSRIDPGFNIAIEDTVSIAVLEKRETHSAVLGYPEFTSDVHSQSDRRRASEAQCAYQFPGREPHLQPRAPCGNTRRRDEQDRNDRQDNEKLDQGHP
jgi:hypothetical protein